MKSSLCPRGQRQDFLCEPAVFMSFQLHRHLGGAGPCPPCVCTTERLDINGWCIDQDCWPGSFFCHLFRWEENTEPAVPLSSGDDAAGHERRAVLHTNIVWKRYSFISLLSSQWPVRVTLMLEEAFSRVFIVFVFGLILVFFRQMKHQKILISARK